VTCKNIFSYLSKQTKIFREKSFSAQKREKEDEGDLLHHMNKGGQKAKPTRGIINTISSSNCLQPLFNEAVG
jgi:hypothetical protein